MRCIIYLVLHGTKRDDILTKIEENVLLYIRIYIYITDKISMNKKNLSIQTGVGNSDFDP